MTLTTGRTWRLHESMSSPLVVSIREARRIAQDTTTQYLIWVDERQAKQFREPGWIALQPPRDGGALFLNRERERRALLPEVDGGAI